MEYVVAFPVHWLEEGEEQHLSVVEASMHD